VVSAREFYLTETLSYNCEKLRLKESFLKERRLSELGSHFLSLIKYDMWGRSMDTMSIQTTPPPSLIPLLFLSLPLGLTKIEKASSFSAAAIFPLLNTIFQ
jgi:hypothetical protein